MEETEYLTYNCFPGYVKRVSAGLTCVRPWRLFGTQDRREPRCHSRGETQVGM